MRVLCSGRAIGAAMLISMALGSIGCSDGGGDGDSEDSKRIDIVPYTDPVERGMLNAMSGGEDTPVFVGPIWLDAKPTPEEASEEDPGDPGRTPFEEVFQIQASGNQPLQVKEICIRGEDGEALNQFVLDPPPEAGTTISPGSSNTAPLRISYRREDPKDRVDRVVVVIRTDAENYPTYLVPFCGRVVAEDKDPLAAIGCGSFITLAPGEDDDTLCSD